MSSIPVRRTTRALRANRDTENAVVARPSRLATRAKSALGSGTTATSVTTRATASTAASKAKSIHADVTKNEKETGVKRKREALSEVTTLGNRPKGALAPLGAKNKDVEKPVKEAVVKPKPVVKPPSRRTGTTLAAKRSTRAGSESSTASSIPVFRPEPAEQPIVLKEEPVVEHVIQKMEIDVVHEEEEPKEEEDVKDEEEARRVFKRRHTDEKPVVHAQLLDDSQVEADKVAAELEAVEPSNVQLWDDLDADDWDDPVMVSEYVVDVCVYLKEIELATLPKANYMEAQTEITWDHRGMLVDWLLQIHARYNLLSESLFLCINVLDRFLASRPISLSKLQLVGLAAFFIATKYEETYAPSVKEVAFLAEDQYTVEEILKAERYILKTLEWDLRAPGPMGWLRRGSKADDCEVHARTIAKYLIEIGLVERRLVALVPSLVSAAGLWLARLTLGREEWTPNLEHYTTYSEKELFPIANIMLEYILTNPIQHESLYKKYASKRYFRASAYMLQWALDRWPENGNVNIAKDLEFIKEEIRKQRELAADEENEEGN
ncbi:hypothetical protein CVT26_009993 [Gymnopilus dilepis]|uniref:Uncharacterized protein n=1 Tax=Gymnopilus dilepis TaxID=231916 RepID=A0A409VL26_9AGAR|nr:hypothetical protein CVT26_009993 [Gymnopilus dilepis]